jgi:hypothetical protein
LKIEACIAEWQQDDRDEERPGRASQRRPDQPHDSEQPEGFGIGDVETVPVQSIEKVPEGPEGSQAFASLLGDDVPVLEPAALSQAESEAVLWAISQSVVLQLNRAPRGAGHGPLLGQENGNWRQGPEDQEKEEIAPESSLKEKGDDQAQPTEESR